MPQAVNDIIALVALGAHPALTKNCGATIQRLSPQVHFSFKKLSLDSLVLSEGHTLSPVVPGIFNRSFLLIFWLLGQIAKMSTTIEKVSAVKSFDYGNEQFTDNAFVQIKEIESEMARTQKNKNTSYHLGTRTPTTFHRWRLLTTRRTTEGEAC